MKKYFGLLILLVVTTCLFSADVDIRRGGSSAGGSATNAQPPSAILTNLAATGAVTNGNANQFTKDNSILTIKNGVLLTNIFNFGILTNVGHTTIEGNFYFFGNGTNEGDIRYNGSQTLAGDVSLLTGNTLTINSGGNFTDNGTFSANGNSIISTNLKFLELGSSATPAANHVALYAKADGNLYQKDDAGTETVLAGGGAGGIGAINVNQFETNNNVLNLKEAALGTNFTSQDTLTVFGTGPFKQEIYGTNTPYATIGADNIGGGLLINTNEVIYTNKTLLIATGGRLAVGPTPAYVTNILTATASLNFPSTLAQTHSDLPITVTGVSTNDAAELGVPFQAVMDNSAYSCFTSNDTVWVRFLNGGALARDPAESVFRALVFKVK